MEGLPMHEAIMSFCRACMLASGEVRIGCAQWSHAHTPAHTQDNKEIKSEPTRDWTCRPWNFSQPICTEKSQMRMVRQASMAARAAPLRLFVTLKPKKLKNAMLTMLPTVDACQPNNCMMSLTASQKASANSRELLCAGPCFKSSRERRLQLTAYQIRICMLAH